MRFFSFYDFNKQVNLNLRHCVQLPGDLTGKVNVASKGVVTSNTGPYNSDSDYSDDKLIDGNRFIQLPFISIE